MPDDLLEPDLPPDGDSPVDDEHEPEGGDLGLAPPD